MRGIQRVDSHNCFVQILSLVAINPEGFWIHLPVVSLRSTTGYPDVIPTGSSRV